MKPNKVRSRVAEAARSFDAEVHTTTYAETHSDAVQLERLLSFIPASHGRVILDLGTGNGYVAMAIAEMRPESRVVGVDIAVQAMSRDREQARARDLSNVDFVGYDGVLLPFADGRFDAAFCRYAFHHFPEPEITLDELSRAVRPGGLLVLADAIRDDADDVDFVNRFQDTKRDGHVRMHRRADLIDLVCRQGFEMIEYFDSSLAFTRERTPEYDALLAGMPGRVLQQYALAVGARDISLTFRIANAVFVNRRIRGNSQPLRVQAYPDENTGRSST